MIAIIDYGVGNLFSLKSSLDMICADSIITNDPDTIKKADKIILPGVGAFRDARKKLSEDGLDKLVIEEVKNGKPIMGICLGMQMLFEKSYEYGEYEGLGLLKGSIRPISDVIGEGLSIPHIGWNPLVIKKESPILKYVKEGECVYFVHSYYAAECDESVASVAEYGALLTASVSLGNVHGCQFHPEKSGRTGLNILKAFAEM